ncbi:MAG: NAD(P)/FAD-dependent oxidoreductase [Candidatus Eremiobacteraeota bacterium]|nr:NAD(P)/FAD-dependent oxidoreductase [Candidatus Eremiobacteraeota bacterium]MBC5827632.1 NAD(P)/FAD-dependent oxidoreductase [Candidatus Eremiobacteraeota bacterium]
MRATYGSPSRPPCARAGEEAAPHVKARLVELFDITVIGGGPTGLFALFYAGMRGAKAKVIDILPELGGQLYALYPEKYIYDMPGYPAVLAQTLVDACVEQAMQWPHAVCLEERVTSIARLEDGYLKITTDRQEHWTKTLILCTGIGAFSPRKLPASSAAAFEGKGLYYYARSFDDFAGKRVVIVGGGDSAVDYALALAPKAADVTIVHRSAFRAHSHTVEQMRNSTIAIRHPDFEVTAVHGNGKVEAVTYANRKTKEQITQECDALLCALGFVSDLGELEQWGIEVEARGVVVDTVTMQTSVEGIYAAGDIIHHAGKLKLIACGTSEAAIAVNQAMAYISPKNKLQPAHSSNLTLPITKKLNLEAE